MKKQSKAFWVVNTTNMGYAEIYIYGYIGDDWSDDGVTSSQFVQDFKKLEQKYDTIKVRINSGGGSIFHGIAIFNAIRNSKVNTEAYIDGMAASMALPVALACKQIYISKYAMVMTHPASGGAYGGVAEMEKVIKLMKELEGSILEIISERTGRSVEDARKRYFENGDHWMSAEEALQDKLVDGIYDGEEVELPKEREIANVYNAFAAVLSYKQDNPILDIKIDTDMKYNLTAEQRKKLGVADDATEEVVAAAINTALTNAAKVTQMAEQLLTLKSEKAQAERAANKEKVDAMLDAAMTNKHINAKQKDVYAKKFADDPAGLKEILDTYEPYADISDITSGKGQSGKAELVEEWNKLDSEGKTEDLAKNDWDKYSSLYEAKYGKAPNPDSKPK